MIFSFLSSTSGILITRKMSASFRAVNEIMSFGILFFFNIILNYYESKLTLNWLNTLLIAIQIFLYFLLFLGNSLINELFEIHFFNLDKDFGKYNDLI